MQRLGSGVVRNGDQLSDGIDVADVSRTLRRQWRAVLGFFAFGVVAAVGVILFAPRRFEGKATLLARATGPEGGSIMGRLQSLGGLMSGGGGLSGLPSPFESELQVLRSRVVAGRAVDSLRLQLSVRDPAGIAPGALFAATDLPGRFKQRVYRFERAADGAYVTSYDGKTYRFTPGVPGALDIGSITLAREGLPNSIRVKVYDREDAITRLSKRLEANKAGGEVASVTYSGEDSITAALVPNLVVAYYLERRKTVDRGTNQRRLEFVAEQYDSTAEALATTERELRDYQERTGVLDAELVGEKWLEGAVAMRESLTAVLVNERSINAMLERTASGSVSPRQLAAFPSFLSAMSVSALSQQLTGLENRRQQLLERRTEKDPEVVAIDESMRAIENQILAMARSYSRSMADTRVALTTQLDSLQDKILALPRAAERGGRLQRDIVRLTTIFTALQAQLVEARLAAIGEGGEVRPIDFAVPPRKPWFPAPLLTMGIGSFGGLLLGCVAALMLGWFGRWLRDPTDIERATGVAVQRFDAKAPLVLSGAATRTILVVPLGEGAQAGAVAQRLVETALVRAMRAKVLDLSNKWSSNGSDAGNPSGLIEKLESEGGLVVVQLPSLIDNATVAALRESRAVVLVAPPGPVDRSRLSSALELLERLGVPCAGVVISDQRAKGIRA